MVRFLIFLIIIVYGCGSTNQKLSRTTDHTNNPSRSVTGKASKSAAGISAKSSKLAQEAAKLIGTPYRYGGDTPGRGFDCSGLTSYVYAKVDHRLPRTSTDQSKIGRRKSLMTAKVGDLVFFGTGNRVNHVGIVVAGSKSGLFVVHSTSSKGVIKENILQSKYWMNRVLWAVEP